MMWFVPQRPRRADPALPADDAALVAETDLLPEWYLPLALGRKAHVPSQPVWLDDGTAIQPGDLNEVLTCHPRIAPARAEHRHQPVRLLLEHATTEFALFLDDDDWLLPGHLARLVHALDEHPEAPDCASEPPDWARTLELSCSS